jgi:acetylxylan esterase
MKFSTLVTGIALAAFAPSAVSAAVLRRVRNFGSNPGDNEMYIYVPNRLAANPPVIVAVR